MPTHTYLRYSQDAAWGVICSGGGQVAVDTTGKLALAPALEAVAVWNVKTGALVQVRFGPQMIQVGPYRIYRICLSMGPHGHIYLVSRI